MIGGDSRETSVLIGGDSSVSGDDEAPTDETAGTVTGAAAGGNALGLLIMLTDMLTLEPKLATVMLSSVIF